MRLIDADKLIQKTVKLAIGGGFTGDFVSIREIDDAPTIDAKPVKPGRWITWKDKFPGKVPKKKNNLGVFCSECKLHADNKSAFCPNCGAKMNQEDTP